MEFLAEAVREAVARRRPLRLRGGGTKDFYGNEPSGEVLDTRAYSGIVSYEPTELVVTARCGTPLSEVERILEENGQCLPFEPPHFGASATFGGCIAAGLSGPRRASAGPLRDFVLGARLVDGRARVLAFGGQVMKNVAGYDVSRLLAGSLGTLGLIAEASIKVLPRPAEELTLRLAMPQERALEALLAWGSQPLPVSATAWQGGELLVRLSGAGPAVRAAATRVGGERVPADPWTAIREQSHPFFAASTIWRIALPPVAPPLDLPGEQLVEWGGALRWVKGEAPANAVREAARLAGGHATLFRAVDKSSGAFTPLAPALARLHRELKAAFDPAGIFNPGRLYAEL